MSEVHRYKVVKMFSEAGNLIRYDPHGPWVVPAQHYDAAQSELSALREDLTNWKTKACEAAERESALREELAHSECMHQNYKIDAQVYKDALIAAEQRNAELCKHLTQAHRFVEATYGMADSGILTAGKDKSTTWNIDESKAILQPYESGASE